MPCNTVIRASVDFNAQSFSMPLLKIALDNQAEKLFSNVFINEQQKTFSFVVDGVRVNVRNGRATAESRGYISEAQVGAWMDKVRQAYTMVSAALAAKQAGWVFRRTSATTFQYERATS